MMNLALMPEQNRLVARTIEVRHDYRQWQGLPGITIGVNTVLFDIVPCPANIGSKRSELPESPESAM